MGDVLVFVVFVVRGYLKSGGGGESDIYSNIYHLHGNLQLGSLIVTYRDVEIMVDSESRTLHQVEPH